MTRTTAPDPTAATPRGPETHAVEGGDSVDGLPYRELDRLAGAWGAGNEAEFLANNAPPTQVAHAPSQEVAP